MRNWRWWLDRCSRCNTYSFPTEPANDETKGTMKYKCAECGHRWTTYWNPEYGKAHGERCEADAREAFLASLKPLSED